MKYSLDSNIGPMKWKPSQYIPKEKKIPNPDKEIQEICLIYEGTCGHWEIPWDLAFKEGSGKLYNLMIETKGSFLDESLLQGFLTSMFHNHVYREQIFENEPYCF